MRSWIFVLAVLAVPFFFQSAFPQSGPPEELLVPSLKQTDVDGLATVLSDQEAKSFFSARLRDAFGLNTIIPDMSSGHPGKSRASQTPLPSPDWIEIGGRLTADLAARQVAMRLKQAASNNDPASLPTVLEQTRGQHPWLLEGNVRAELARAVKLAAVLSDLVHSAPGTTTPVLIEPYDDYLDRTYPEFIDTENSWVTIAERAGTTGVRQRLTEFWDKNSDARPGVSEAEKQTLASHYFHSRLRPVLLAQVTASAIRAEVIAEQHARTHWISLKAWPDKVRESKGLARLCGTWQWTIHNHQHHQDQKVAMVFPPPDAGSFTGARPAKTVVLGDAIYLRWEFPGVVQEDSLLFTGEGQRLEGSFVNSSGAWGSITGKRTATCGR
jgi:hypothetical protein